MLDNLPNIAFDPLLSIGWIIALGILTVSYTHLTLPTIYSV